MICAFTSLILAAAFAQAVPGPRITIFVGPQGRDGIHNVDSGIADSITDIKNELRRSGLFMLASTPDGAVLSLVVVTRHASGSDPFVRVTAPGAITAGGNVAEVQQPGVQMPSLSTSVTMKGRVLETKLRVAGREETFLSGDDSESWRYTARQVVKDLTAWVNANRDAIPVKRP